MPSDFIQKLSEIKDLVHISRMQTIRVKRFRKKKKHNTREEFFDNNFKENSIDNERDMPKPMSTDNFSKILNEISSQSVYQTQSFSKIRSVFENLNSCESLIETSYTPMDLEKLPLQRQNSI